MSVPLCAADVLGEHVAFELEFIDRVYCNAYVRKLTYPGGVASFFTHHRGSSFAEAIRRCEYRPHKTTDLARLASA